MTWRTGDRQKRAWRFWAVGSQGMSNSWCHDQQKAGCALPHRNACSHTRCSEPSYACYSQHEHVRDNSTPCLFSIVRRGLAWHEIGWSRLANRKRVPRPVFLHYANDAPSYLVVERSRGKVADPSSPVVDTRGPSHIPRTPRQHPAVAIEHLYTQETVYTQPCIRDVARRSRDYVVWKQGRAGVGNLTKGMELKSGRDDAHDVPSQLHAGHECGRLLEGTRSSSNAQPACLGGHGTACRKTGMFAPAQLSDKHHYNIWHSVAEQRTSHNGGRAVSKSGPSIWAVPKLARRTKISFTLV